MKYKILVVDDEPANLRILERMFRRSYDVLSCASGEEALQMLELHDTALIISDQRMPGMTGIEFLKRASEMRPRTVRIILTGYTDINDLVEAINSGVIYKYITKPWINEELRQTVVRGLEHYEVFKDRHDLVQHSARLSEQLAASKAGLVNVISEALRAKDPTVTDRCRRIVDNASALGRWLNLDEEAVEQLSLAANLCEIGSLSTPNEAASSAQSLQGEEGSELLGKSSAFWAAMLDDIPAMEDIALAIRFQHAHFDGNGFPSGLSGEQIPLWSRILSVVTAFEFVSTRQAGNEEGFRSLRLAAGKRFDPELVEAFCVASAIESPRPELAAFETRESVLS